MKKLLSNIITFRISRWRDSYEFGDQWWVETRDYFNHESSLFWAVIDFFRYPNEKA